MTTPMRFAAAVLAALIIMAIAFVSSAPPALALASTFTTYQYGPDPSEFTRVYVGAAPGEPLIVLVHGGGFKSGPNANMQSTEANQLHGQGFAVLDMNYVGDATAPAFPAEVNDVMTVARWGLVNAASLNANAGRLTVLGGSSAGLLVSRATQELDADVAGMVRHVITLSGPSDFPTALAYFSSLGTKPAQVHVNNELAALGCTLIGTCPPSTEQTWSPAENVTPQNCPTATEIFNGNAELMPVQQADMMTQALQAHGCQVTEVVFQDTLHSFAYWSTVFPSIVQFVSS